MFDKIAEKYHKHELTKLIKFGTVGVCNTAVDFIIFWISSEWFGLSVYSSQTVAYCTATLNSYLLNSSWTFDNGRSYSLWQFIKFICINITSLCTSLLLLYLFNGIMNWDKMTTKVIITFFTFAINYFGNRLWVFYKKN